MLTRLSAQPGIFLDLWQSNTRELTPKQWASVLSPLVLFQGTTLRRPVTRKEKVTMMLDSFKLLPLFSQQLCFLQVSYYLCRSSAERIIRLWIFNEVATSLCYYHFGLLHWRQTTKKSLYHSASQKQRVRTSITQNTLISRCIKRASLTKSRLNKNA